MISTKKKLLGTTVNPTNGDGWEDDDGSESAELHKNKKGQYVAGTLFVILDWRPTRTVQSAIKRCPYVINYAGASHDLDTYSQEDLEKALSKGREIDWGVGDSKKHHCHVFLRTKQVRADTLAKALGIDVKFVRYLPKNRIYGMLCYLTHKGWEEKHQYQESDVWSNFDWIAERDGEKKVNELDEILKRIEAGEITKTNVTQCLTMAQYVKYKVKLQDAFWYYDQVHKHDKNARLCVYVTSGVAGSGKSTLAEMLAKVIASRHGWDYAYGGNGRDVWGDYNGEEILILDDKSFGDMGRDSWLNTFDLFVKGSMDSRFKNKNASNIRMIIVTNILSFEDNVGKIKDLSDDEDRSQFTRRFQLVADVQEDVITLYKYNTSTKQYAVHEKINNYLTAYIRQAGRGNADAMLAEVTDAVRAIQHEAEVRLNRSGQDAQKIEDAERLENGAIEL